MTDADAADVFERWHIDGMPARAKEFEDAKKVLRKRFASNGSNLYRRTIACARRASRRFSRDLAVEKGWLTEAQVEACKVDTEQLVLSYVGPVAPEE